MSSERVLERSPALNDLERLYILINHNYILLFPEKFTDRRSKSLLKFKNLNTLILQDLWVTDDGLVEIAKMDSIEVLSLVGSRFSNRGAAALRGMKRLKTLRLNKGPHSIDDAGLEAIAAIENLENLDLYDSQITDRGLEMLAKIPRLKTIRLLGNKKLTYEGINQFKNARQDVGVTHFP